jgi:hypothetical protein
VAGAVVAMVILAAIGASYQILVEWREANRFPAPGALVEVGGRKLHVICTGAGALGTSLQYAAVQSAIAATHRVCSYDRAPGAGHRRGTGARSRASAASG